MRGKGREREREREAVAVIYHFIAPELESDQGVTRAVVRAGLA